MDLSRKLPRPFGDTHLLLWASLAALWVLLLFTQQCNERGDVPLAVLATFTLCMAWRGRAGLRSDAVGWQRLPRAIAWAAYDLGMLVISVIVLAVPIALFMPTYQCYTPRAKVAELLLSTSSVRTEIAGRVAQRRPLTGIGAGLHVEPQGRAKQALVTSDGVIIVAGDDPPAVAVLTPSIVAGELRWRCVLVPETYAPSPCR